MNHHITSYEIIRHGVEHIQYFQGCGTSFTDFDHVQTGIGDTEKEAFEDALEQLACCHAPDDGSLKRLQWDCEHTDWDTRDVSQVIADVLGEPEGEEDSDNEPSETYWRVSIRYNAEQRETIPA